MNPFQDRGPEIVRLSPRALSGRHTLPGMLGGLAGHHGVASRRRAGHDAAVSLRREQRMAVEARDGMVSLRLSGDASPAPSSFARCPVLEGRRADSSACGGIGLAIPSLPTSTSRLTPGFALRT